MSLIQKMRRTRYLVRGRSERMGRWRWIWAVVIPDESAGIIIVKKPWWAIFRTLYEEFTPAQVSRFEVELRDPLLREGLFPWLIAALTGMKVPVLKLTQAVEGGAVRQVSLRAAQPGRVGRVLIRFVGLDIADFLRRHGYGGPLPDFTDDERWRVPLVTVIVTYVIGLAILAACLLLAVLPALVESMGN